MSSVVPVNIDILHIASCPHLDGVRSSVADALVAAGIGASVREIEIATSEEAARLGMHGSPTILIDGTDPFPTEAAIGSLSCRLYPAGDAMSGAPSVAQLADVIGGKPCS